MNHTHAFNETTQRNWLVRSCKSMVPRTIPRSLLQKESQSSRRRGMMAPQLKRETLERKGVKEEYLFAVSPGGVYCMCIVE
jgi:hypothetical protein